MAILAECPVCHRKQSPRNRLCKCGESLLQAKRSKRVKFWISFYLPGGKQRREYVGNSIEEAKAAEGKRRGQKKENRIFDMLPGSDITFEELTNWFLGLSSIQRLTSYPRYKIALANFNEILGSTTVGKILPADLEEYQNFRLQQGILPATVDLEIQVAKRMVNKAFDNDKVDGHAVKAFRRVNPALKRGSNARDRVLTVEEYISLRNAAQTHLRALLITAYNTGMRKGELLNLQWGHIDCEKWFIRLPAQLTKEKKAKSISINHHVKKVLEELPRGLHHDFVFTYNGQPIKLFFTVALKGACKRAGIVFGMKKEGGFRFHDIRRTVKTNMLRAGVDKALRDAILGHSMTGMDVYYLKPSDEDLREAMKKYTTWLDRETDLILQNSDQTIDQEGF